MSWIFFLLTLGLTSVFASLLSLWRDDIVLGLGDEGGKEGEDIERRREIMWYATTDL